MFNVRFFTFRFYIFLLFMYRICCNFFLISFLVLLHIFDLIAVLFGTYDEILSVPYLHKTVNDYFFLCQEACVYIKILGSICFEN